MLQTTIRNFLVGTLTMLVKVYQHTFALIFPPACRYTPSCSQYAIDALNKYGPLVGLYRAARRVLRCHPFSSHNSYDPA